MNDKLRQQLLKENSLYTLIEPKRQRIFDTVDAWYLDWLGPCDVPTDVGEAKYREIFSKVLAFGRTYA